MHGNAASLTDTFVFLLGLSTINTIRRVIWCTAQGWIKCGSGEHRSQEMARKIEEIVTLGCEEKREEEEREEEEKKKEEKRKKKRKKKKEEKRKKKRKKKRKRGKKKEVEIEELTEEDEEHGDDELKSSKANV